MLNRFNRYIEKHQLLNSSDKALLAVSGGADSMVMLHLFQRIDAKIEVAHCNFHLRGSESDADEQYVTAYCKNNGIELHVANFNTAEYVKLHKVSVEVAARELRYDFFDKICAQTGCTKIAVAHNLNDSAETVILNILRGTGIRGLTGIHPINGRIIRPLLFATRVEIEHYAADYGIEFCTDSTNTDTIYRRNYIRHTIMPELRTLNPSVDLSIAKTATFAQQALFLVERQLEQIRGSIISYEHNNVLFSIEALKGEQCAQMFLVEELTKYGFSAQQAEQVAELIHQESGRRVESSTHTIYRDRDRLILLEKVVHVDDEVEVFEDVCSISSPIKLRFERLGVNAEIEKNQHVAFVDFDRLKFPMCLRRWRFGDRIMPFGMRGFKKVSDLLVDAKIPLLEKKNVFVLTSDDEIVWVVGLRLDNRYAVSANTLNILKISIC